jgi:hypothetical protein
LIFGCPFGVAARCFVTPCHYGRVVMDLKPQVENQPTYVEDRALSGPLPTMDFVERCFIVEAMAAFLVLMASIAWMWM